MNARFFPAVPPTERHEAASEVRDYTRADAAISHLVL